MRLGLCIYHGMGSGVSYAEIRIGVSLAVYGLYSTVLVSRLILFSISSIRDRKKAQIALSGKGGMSDRLFRYL